MTLDFPHHTVADLAREDDLSPAAMRSKLARFGMRALYEADRTPLHRAELMPNHDAVDYLKDALQLAYDALAVGKRWPGMSATESRIMFALHRTYVAGGYKSRDSLRAVAQLDPHKEVTSSKAVDVYLHKIRGKLAAENKWRIVCVRGCGYTLEKPAALATCGGSGLTAGS